MTGDNEPETKFIGTRKLKIKAFADRALAALSGLNGAPQAKDIWFVTYVPDKRNILLCLTAEQMRERRKNIYDFDGHDQEFFADEGPLAARYIARRIAAASEKEVRENPATDVASYELV
jgi:hypothetical protein